MKNSRTAVIALILVGLLSIPGRAQGVPGRWEKVEALKLGPQITVELKNGARIEGQCEELSSSELLLRTGTAQARIPRADIDRITTREADGLGNGILIGAGVGAGSMASTALLTLVPDLDLEVNAIGMALWVAMAAGVGAAIGMGIDASKETEVVLYQAP